MTMRADDVLEVLDRLDTAGVETWLDGGWAVDAVLGEQTRPHDDLDLIARIADLVALREALAPADFEEVAGGRDVNFVLRDGAGREVDVHAIAFDDRGDGRYPMVDGSEWVFPADGFSGRGWIAGHEVRCLTADVQMLCHAHGYLPGPTDIHDMRLLNTRLGTRLLPPYDLDVQLREVEDRDLEVFFEHQQDPVATELAAFPARDRATFMEHAARIRADPTVTYRTILVDGQVAGNIVAWDDDGQDDVGYWLGREWWGRGIATRALAAFLRELPNRPLFAHVAKRNAASTRVLQKCGFRVIGSARVEPEGIDELVLRLDA